MAYLLLLLIIAAAIWLLAIKTKKLNKKETEKAVTFGIGLLIFDFIFESIGAMLGLWTINESLFMIGAVPFEVSLIAFFAGYVFTMVFPRKIKPPMGALFIFLIAVIGVSFEIILVHYGVLTYLAGWTSFHALVAYFVVFYAILELNAKIKP